MIKINHKLINLYKDKDKYIKKKAQNGNNILKNIIRLCHLEKTIGLLVFLNHMICISIQLKLIGKTENNILKSIENILIKHNNNV